MKYMILLLALFVFSCEECEPEATRCNDSTVEICNADGRWESVMNCRDAEPGVWFCVEPDTDGDTDPSTVEESSHCELEVSK